ncbi:amidohydrolase [Desulfobacter hydrogenophilus]|uniref:Amidohydrolase n=1 Tax=Desulfobacter hydrogenophilus TaxID=2291 RepID=A0A328FHH5_9BACT|nr:nitrilase-related carbon-nitrogen hydrolase [Desulfobacter hydrogenophilus]NDY71643.1 amidohydrolase [Desulfobacter hydrogenophilus]QBH15420.1 amidohydrolase [Desulfobacter hydrogenophilus]RAM02497.1 amidohydrolase [Desulfobacter hydrogenophilus]
MQNIRVTLVIQNCPVNRFAHNFAQTVKQVSAAALQNCDFVVFPEMNLTGYAPANLSNAVALDSVWINKLNRLAQKHNIAILTGLVEKAAAGKIYATHLVIRPDQPVARYRKIHLSPFEAPYFSCGDDADVFKFKGVYFGIQLCYDAHFPELSTAMALKRADIIFFPHASPRGTPGEKSASWKRHLTARAFDNAVFVAAVNQVGENNAGLDFPGISMMIGPDGFLAGENIAYENKIKTHVLDMSLLEHIRTHKMRYFLPNRRGNLIDE